MNIELFERLCRDAEATECGWSAKILALAEEGLIVSQVHDEIMFSFPKENNHAC